jgi:hypothetical protein
MNAALPLVSRPGAALSRLDLAILWPLVYGSIFRAPVPRDALHARLVGVAATSDEMNRALAGPALRPLIVERDGLVWLRQPGIERMEAEFRMRRRATRELLRSHEEILRFLRRRPGLRFAALSGGCAHDAADDGDIDVFVVTESGMLWRTLLQSTLIAKARGWRRVLCLNYIVDATAQSLPGGDFYSAFELVTLKPIAAESGYADLLRANPWAVPIFPNFVPAGLGGQNRANSKMPTRAGQLLEATARMIHRPYLRSRLPKGSGVELSAHLVRLHATDHRPRVRGLFRDALERMGLEAPPWI